MAQRLETAVLARVGVGRLQRIVELDANLLPEIVHQPAPLHRQKQPQLPPRKSPRPPPPPNPSQQMAPAERPLPASARRSETAAASTVFVARHQIIVGRGVTPLVEHVRAALRLRRNLPRLRQPSLPRALLRPVRPRVRRLRSQAMGRVLGRRSLRVREARMEIVARSMDGVAQPPHIV